MMLYRRESFLQMQAYFPNKQYHHLSVPLPAIFYFAANPSVPDRQHNFGIRSLLHGYAYLQVPVRQAYFGHQ